MDTEKKEEAHNNSNSGGGFFDLERQFAFYGAYHSNWVNVLIHVLFVWPILFTSLILFHYTPPIITTGIRTTNLDLNLGFFVALLYGLFYVAMDRRAGALAALLCILCWIASQTLAARLTFSTAWKVVLVAQLFCWTWQFIGHGVFEKRAPALLDNLAQAFLMAPFFVLLEVLDNFFGYEPYPGFHAKVHARIEADRKEWRDHEQKKIS